MNFIWITVAYLSVVALGVAVFIWGKPRGNSLFDRLYQVFCIHFPRLCKVALLKCCGPRAPAALDATWTYIAFSSNPLVQLFYLAVVGGGFMLFLIVGYPSLPSRYIAWPHKLGGIATFVACVSIWWRAATTDPGIVTAQNVDALCEIYEWDNKIFGAAMCETCKVMKPARSKTLFALQSLRF